MLVTRSSYIEKIDNAFRYTSIAVLIGARQVGKTSIMKCYVENKPHLLLNGQDAEMAALFAKLSTIEQYLTIQLNAELKGLLLIDEFQYIDGVSTIMKLLTDKYPDLKILCSGSSSLDILQQVEESLAGRVRVIEVLSLSFSEFLLFKDKKLNQMQQSIEIQSANALTAPVEAKLNEYLIYGGLPRVVLADSPSDKVELLNDIYQTYLLRDVRMYIANEHFVGFNKLLRLLSMQIGNLVNINDLSKECGLTYKKCEEYIYLLQQMYIIRMIEPFHSNKRKSVSKMNKVYFYDIGLRNIIYNSFNEMDFRVDNGAIFENYVLLELWRKRRAAGTVQFFRTQSGTEVDFVTIQEDDVKVIECKYKRHEKAISVPNMTNFAREEGFQKQFLVNINLCQTNQDVQYIPGIFVDRI
jgi:predicted AAA+ superfamily ATPase